MKRFSVSLRILVVVLIVPAAVLVTLATGELHVVGWGFGLPLPWKIDWGSDCGSLFFNPGACPRPPIGSFVYNWFFFALDVLFYTGIGEGLFLAIRNLRQSSAIPSSKA
jgi:hypothetical protein